MLPICTVADTAFNNVETVFTVPPAIETTVQRRPPSKPPEVHVCGGELYWTMTFTLPDGFVSKGSRSGEILEESATADPDITKNTSAAYIRCIGRNRDLNGKVPVVIGFLIAAMT